MAYLSVLTLIIQLFSTMNLGFITADAGTDLGNIFTFERLLLGDKNTGTPFPTTGGAINIDNDTELYLEYTWSINEGVSDGNYSEIVVPEVFLLYGDISGQNIEVSDPDSPVIGTYSLINGILRFEFDSRVDSNKSYAGTVGFGIKFNLDKFEEDVVQEVSFNDQTSKTFNIVAEPEKVVAAIDKTGVPDSQKDAREIIWAIDIVNVENSEIHNVNILDNLPAGLDIDSSSINIYELSVMLNGETTRGSKVTSGPAITTSGTSIGVDFPNLGPYEGYRLEFISTITDYEKTSFSNNAVFSYGVTSHGAIATVSNLERSEFIEKEGSYLGNDQIEWIIDINKAGGTIGEAIVNDTLPNGLTLTTPGAISVYKLTQSGSSWTEEFDNTKNYIDFPINLGELTNSDAYRVKVVTDIDYSLVNSGIYQKLNSFENDARLYDGMQEIGQSSTTVNITRGDILRKIGSSNVSYNNKTLTWTVHINEALHSLEDVNLIDIIPEGLSITTGAISISDSNNNTITGSAITITNQADGTTKLEVSLGELNNEYRKVVYTVEVIDFSKDQFTNKASLTGTNVGNGGQEITSNINPPASTFTKTSTDINYANKTISWRIRINPRREPISELKLIDSYSRKGLIMLPDSLTVKLGSTELVKNTDYIITPNTDGSETGYHKGFIMEFIDSTSPSAVLDEPINQLVTIEFDTSFDPEKEVEGNFLETGTDPNMKYYNNVSFIGKTLSGQEIDKSAEANRQAITSSWNSGKKEGKLVSKNSNNEIEDGWISGNQRLIDWEVYINYLEETLNTSGSAISLSDTLKYNGEVIESSIIVKEYDVLSDGSTSITDTILDPSNYVVSFSSDKKTFDLVFDGSFIVDKRYVIVFQTTVPDLSQAVYENEAVLKRVGSELGKFTSSISYSRFDDMLKKSADTNSTTVFTDDELNWTISINESLSVIDDLEVEDTISEGLIYKNDSLIVSRLDGNSWEVVEVSDYNLDIDTSGSETIIKVTFNSTLQHEYRIDYITLVVADGAEVSNSVEINGTQITVTTIESEKLSARKFSFIDGAPIANRGSIKIRKVDQDNNLITSSNAKFKLFYEFNGVEYLYGDQEFETISGELEILNLPLRTYYLEETVSPEGYLIDDKRLTINVINAEEYQIDVENEQIIGSIKIIKHDDSGQSLEGSKFGIYDTASNLVEEKVSNASGEIIFTGLPYGNYTLKEIEAPVSYFASSREESVQIVNHGETVELASPFVNTKIRGDIEVIKLDEETGALLQGAEFALKQAGNVKHSGITDVSGKVIFTGIEYGQYDLIEISPPEGYNTNNNTYTVVVDETSPSHQTVNIENQIIKGSVKAIKNDDKGQPLEGAKFGIYDTASNLVEEKVSNTSGEIIFTGLPYGDYTLKEIEAPTSYFASSREESVQIVNHGETVELASPFVNTKIRGDIEVTKLDEETGALLQGAEFALKQAGNVKHSGITDVSGKVIFTGIEYGQYELVEISPPEGYNSGDTTYNVIVDENTAGIQNFTFENKIIRGNIVLVKHDENGNPLAGATFALYDLLNNKISEVQSDADGRALFDNVPYGDYLIKEILAPISYSASNKEVNIEIRSEGQTITINEPFVNSKIKGDIEVIKRDVENGLPLEGARFALKQSGDTKYVGLTDDTGSFVFNSVLYGEYSLVEIGPPNGFNPTNLTYDVKIDEDTSGLQRFIFENQIIKGDIRIVKLGEDQEGLAGATFGLYKKEDVSFINLIASVTSQADGSVVFSNISFGEYAIKELEAPEDYNLSSDLIYVTILEDAELVEPLNNQVENTKIRGNIEIVKKSRNSGMPLEGATIAVFDENDEMVEEKITTDDGKVMFSNLVYGEYYYQEISSPSGYVLDRTKYPFEIRDNGHTLIFELENIRRTVSPPIPPDSEEVIPELPEEPMEPLVPEEEDEDKPEVPSPEDSDDTMTPGEPGKEIEGPMEPPGQGEHLPDTGYVANSIFYLLGMVFVLLGVGIKKRN
jgi:uncharacterized surface anchored protein